MKGSRKAAKPAKRKHQSLLCAFASWREILFLLIQRQIGATDRQIDQFVY